MNALMRTKLQIERMPAKKQTAGGMPPADRRCQLELRSRYALFIAPFTASAVIGSARTRAPQALKIAFASAGAITVTAGSPTPVAFSPLAMTLMATSGSWDIRSGV
jgi:hypothetical protein